jgi:hypothetical protein
MPVDQSQESQKVMIAVENIDLIIGAAKKVKSATKKHAAKKADEDMLRVQSRELMKEAHEVTGQMMAEENASEARQKELREQNARIQKELAKTNNKIDKLIDKANDEWDAVIEAHKQLLRIVQGEAAENDALEADTVPDDQAREAEDQAAEEQPEGALE